MHDLIRAHRRTFFQDGAVYTYGPPAVADPRDFLPDDAVSVDQRTNWEIALRWVRGAAITGHSVAPEPGDWGIGFSRLRDEEIDE